MHRAMGPVSRNDGYVTGQRNAPIAIRELRNRFASGSGAPDSIGQWRESARTRLAILLREFTPGASHATFGFSLHAARRHRVIARRGSVNFASRPPGRPAERRKRFVRAWRLG